MAWFTAVLQAALAAFVLRAAAQDNPFGETATAEAAAATPADATLPSAATVVDPALNAQTEEPPASHHGRRLSAGLENFEVAFKDSNGTDMQDMEEIEQVVIGFTFGSGAGSADAVEITVPALIFTVGMSLSLPGGAGRRLGEEGTDAYGRRLAAATCFIQSVPAPAVQVCTGNPSSTCLRLNLARSDGTTPCGAGDVLASTPVSGSFPTSVPAGNYQMDAQTTTGNPPVQVPGGFATTSVVVPQTNGLAISDPITFYKGKKTKFWLPVEGEHLLVQTTDLAIYASVFQGPRTDLQWFDRFSIRHPDGRQVVEVGVKRESINQNSTASRHHRMFSQLDIKMGSSEVPLHKLQRTLFSFRDSAVKVGVGTQRYDPPRLHGQPVTEFVHVETPSISFVLVASHAGNEFPNDIELQKKHAHLDWITREMVGTKSFTGILPQIWGVQQPLSAQVAAMLQEPSEATQICAEV